MKPGRITACAVILGAALAPEATAQASLGLDAAFYSQYVWRGLTMTNNPVFQPAAYFNVPLGPAGFSVGVSPNIELGQYNGPNDISMNGGTGSFSVTELDYFAKVGTDLGILRVVGGVNGLYYPDGLYWGGKTAQPELSNTFEINGRAQLRIPLNPQVTLWYDIDKVKGLYYEAGLGQHFPLGPIAALKLDAIAGFSAGQEKNAQKPNENWWFKESGFTAARFTVSLPVTVRAFQIIPSVNFQVNEDPFTKWTKGEPGTPTGFNSDGSKAWFGIMFSWSRGFGGAPR